MRKIFSVVLILVILSVIACQPKIVDKPRQQTTGGDLSKTTTSGDIAGKGADTSVGTTSGGGAPTGGSTADTVEKDLSTSDTDLDSILTEINQI